MPLRIGRKIGFAALFVAGAALTPGTLSGDPSRVLTTFLGLFSASILPTVTLLVNSMTVNGRSVQGLNKLQEELDAALDALFFLFGCVGVAFGALVCLSFSTPNVLSQVPYLTTEILPRLGQSLVVSATGMVIWRAGQIPGILRRSLKVRHEIALNEARSKLESKSPSGNDIKKMFPAHPDFGTVVPLQELHGPENRQ